MTSSSGSGPPRRGVRILRDVHRDTVDGTAIRAAAEGCVRKTFRPSDLRDGDPGRGRHPGLTAIMIFARTVLC